MELKQRLLANERTIGIMLSELTTPNLARLLANFGFDFLLVDCEHGYYDLTQVANLIAVADGVNMPVIVRVAPHSQSSVGKYLDMGARGILLSNVENAAQAHELAQMCLYSPEGNRGVSTFRAHTGYNGSDMGSVMREANQRVLVICQIESPQAVADVDEIAAVAGVDGLLIGPNDLTQHMGIIGQFEHPDVLNALRDVAVAAALQGKWSGIITGNEGLLRAGRAAGMCCFSAGSELNALAAGAAALYKRACDLVESET